MEKVILPFLLDKRSEEAVEVQKILTEYGCIIRTRLGLHDADESMCSDFGLIILELIGDRSQQESLHKKLNRVHGVKGKLVVLSGK
ncbi:MAG: hypothetical protein DKM50_11285 [Candidatus Margulisiibacteriota bacterium]|nr:MAG: hypothetical protein A2X43_12220 [Candidatus Margulisbacteria bacterium GWD2_39_127]OGI03220.1 MAG: hypothetical protein A2X42_11460 [Candidatus Margulisbacteria bacterium GWF2_38_17]OGI11244.1 MAG: hypothetical protein A2X41_03885 [Candidatus Margulisbacteria bacterium GWE2_39_32]PZM78539.1 MAG: hypothetical protein DKM50_11285 [Candidatus Margulisiibacteriota bacterium]HAR63895.1 hypothetical protein [Candidatus Margulisiibacteriota bacterium]